MCRVSQPHVLIVSYWFPPAVGAAAERMVAFAQYLAKLDWRVSVLCAEHGPPPVLDGVSTYPVADPLKKDSPAFADYDPRVSPPAWKSFARRFIFPDRFVKWRKAAEAHLAEKRQQIDADIVLASFPPASAATLGAAAANLLNVPLVLDYRDRWLGEGGYAPDNAKQRAKHEALERACVSAARGITTVSDNMARAMIAEHGLDQRRVAVVANGYFPEADERGEMSAAVAYRDETEAAQVENATEPNATTPSASRTLTIAHVGTVIARNHPDRFFDLIQRVHESSNDTLSCFRFDFIGNLSRDYLISLNLGNTVTTTGLVDRATARSAMRDADALLLLVGDYVGHWGHNAKLFEYVQTGHPILCIETTPESNDGQLLRQFVPDRSFFADFDDPNRLIDAINALQTYLQTRPTAALELGAGFRAYSRREQTEKLATFMTGLLKDRST